VTTRAVHLERLQAGLIELCETLVPAATAVWSPSELPRGAAADLIIACRLLAGPDDDPMGGSSATPCELPLTATLRILDAVEDESIVLQASGRSFEYVIEAGDDVAAVRDGLLAVIAASPGSLVDATFEADATPIPDPDPDIEDLIQIEAESLGDLYHLRLRQSVSGLASLTVNTTGAGLAQSVDVRSWVELQAVSTSRAPRSGAAAALSAILGRRNLPAAQAIMERYGLAFTGAPGRIVGIDALAGPSWQSRSAVTLYVSQVGLVVEPVGAITRARATLEARGATTAPITISLDVDTEE
jgi:hypothetical protein